MSRNRSLQHLAGLTPTQVQDLLERRHPGPGRAMPVNMCRVTPARLCRVMPTDAYRTMPVNGCRTMPGDAGHCRVVPVGADRGEAGGCRVMPTAGCCRVRLI
jgi:hypothetical protein